MARRAKRRFGNGGPLSPAVTLAVSLRTVHSKECAMNAIELLEQEHEVMKKLLDKAVELEDGAQRRQALQHIINDFRSHEEIEEKIFYPALKEHPKAKDIVLEGYEEHHVVDLLIQELEAMPPKDERWAAKLKVLKENVEHHIEEEEGEMFKTARKVFEREELETLGSRMVELKAGRPA
jgi:hemerythrin-like domain-containing protein